MKGIVLNGSSGRRIDSYIGYTQIFYKVSYFQLNSEQ